MKQEYVDFLADDNNFETVYQLSQNFETFQQYIQNKTWNDLLNYLGKKNLKFTFCDNDLLPCSQEKSVKNYFKRSKNTYGLCYKITEKEDVGIYCYIELNHHLYYSITLANKDGLRLPKCPLDMVDFKEKVKELHKNWKYQDKNKNLGGQVYPQRTVNFKNPNDNFFDIVHEQKRQQWIAETADDIIQLVNDVKNINVQQA